MSDYEGRRRSQAGLPERLRGMATLPTLATGLVVIVILVVSMRMLGTPTGSNGVLPELPPMPTELVDPAAPTAQPPDGPGPSLPPSRLPQIMRYEAEDALISQGIVDNKHAGYSGSGFVDYANIVGSYAQWTVLAAQAGSVVVRLRYANGSSANRPMDIVVNGAVAIRGLAFEKTGAWTNWQVRTFALKLKAGSNTIRAVATSAGGGPNTDYLEIEQ